MGKAARNYYTSEYVDGNTVRKMAPAKPERRVEPKRRTRQREEVVINEKELTMNAPYVAFLAVVTVVCLVMCVLYLGLQSDITSTRRNITSLKTQISTVQSQNDALNYSINSYIDTNRIQKVAKTKLGMAQATDDQISNYKPSDSGYTVQYGDIPVK